MVYHSLNVLGPVVIAICWWCTTVVTQSTVENGGGKDQCDYGEIRLLLKTQSPDHQAPTCVESTGGDDMCLPLISTQQCDESHFAVLRCAKMMKQAGYFTLDASSTSRPPVFCEAIEPSRICFENSYEVSADLFNLFGESSNKNNADGGHPGIIYNIRDHKNFDVVYLRPHRYDEDSCYQLGYLLNEEFKSMKTGPCASKIRPRKWFNLRLVITGQNVEVYIDGDFLTSGTNYFQPKGSAGVATWRGYDNIIRFKNFQMKGK